MSLQALNHEFYTVLENSSYADIVSLCKTSHRYRELCRNPGAERIISAKLQDRIDEIVRKLHNVPLNTNRIYPFNQIRLDSTDPNTEFVLSYTNKVNVIYKMREWRPQIDFVLDKIRGRKKEEYTYTNLTVNSEYEIRNILRQLLVRGYII